MNPLLEAYNTPFDTVPFDKIKPEHFEEAFEAALIEGRKQVDAIANASDNATFENTIEALDAAGNQLSEIASILFNLNHAETNDEIQGIARIMAPKLSEFSNDITLNPILFERVKTVHYNNNQELNHEQQMLLDKTYKNFIRSGANLNDSDKDPFRKNSQRLSELTVQFSENILAETNAFTLHIENQKDLAGLPDGIIETARHEAEQEKLPGWLFTLQFPSFGPFMKYAENRELRKQMLLASGTRGLKDNQNDNREIIREIVNLRISQAKLLGFKTHAEYTLDNRMAQKPGKVMTFLNDLKDAYWEAAKPEVEEVQNHAKKLGANFQIEAWDWTYYAEKLRETKYGINDELLRPYFELENTLNKVFDLANKLYGITFSENAEIPKYHADVRCFEVYDSNKDLLSILYLDFFPRKTKKPGAWMTEFKDQYRTNNKDHRPHISLVFNFPKPTNDKLSLLTYSDLRTLLHEFGHGLHGLFSMVTYKSLSGTSVYRDFVELPSQIMENWAEQKEWLTEVAIHHKTNEPMPSDLMDQVLESKNYNEGNFGIRQLGFGFIDMAWHSLEENFEGDVIEFEKEVMAPLALLPRIAETAASPAFGHIFAGGYAAGYYGYKWAEVLDADAFNLFKEKGIFDKETATRFRETILSKGGSKHPMELFIDFMGREPKVDALLERSGLK